MEAGREPLPTRIQDLPMLPPRTGRAGTRPRATSASTLDSRPARPSTDTSGCCSRGRTRINLTAIREPAAVATAHVVDSLSAVPVLRERAADRILDLGSGGGFPGLPIAAACPARPSTWSEPIGKKAGFLRTVVEATGLAERVTVRARRAEALAADRARRGSWSVVIARAVASTADLVELAFPLLGRGGVLIAWKRGDLDAELGAARRAVDALGGGTVEVRDVALADLPGHRLVVATRRGDVPAAYPRDPAARRRRPW